MRTYPFPTSFVQNTSNHCLFKRHPEINYYPSILNHINLPLHRERAHVRFPRKASHTHSLGARTEAQGSTAQGRGGKEHPSHCPGLPARPTPGSPLALAGKGQLSPFPAGVAPFEGSKQVLKERKRARVYGECPRTMREGSARMKGPGFWEF